MTRIALTTTRVHGCSIIKNKYSSSAQSKCNRSSCQLQMLLLLLAPYQCRFPVYRQGAMSHLFHKAVARQQDTMKGSALSQRIEHTKGSLCAKAMLYWHATCKQQLPVLDSNLISKVYFLLSTLHTILDSIFGTHRLTVSN